jgi:hypothetical protein
MSATGTTRMVCVIRVLEADLRPQAVAIHGIKHSACASVLLMRSGLKGKVWAYWQIIKQFPNLCSPRGKPVAPTKLTGSGAADRATGGV